MVNLDAYAGPFEVLLSMIASRQLELTEVSLASVTGEFLTYVRGLSSAAGAGSMDEASAFLDVAAVLVEAKSAALLPADEAGRRDDQGMEALRERDLLFARLLQYRAFREAARDLAARLAANAGRYAHSPYMDDALAGALPELVWTLAPPQLAALAAHALANAPAEQVSVHQLHVPPVNMQAEAALVARRLTAVPRGDSVTFAALTADAHGNLEVVARFLALLVFFKQGAVQFRQDGPYHPLHVRWVPGAAADIDMGNETDE